MAEWLPIETAPTETRIFLWCTDKGFGARGEHGLMGTVFGKVVEFGDGERRCYAEGMNGDWSFTHWMPLPPAPSPSVVEGGE